MSDSLRPVLCEHEPAEWIDLYLKRYLALEPGCAQGALEPQFKPADA